MIAAVLARPTFVEITATGTMIFLAAIAWFH